MLICYENVGIKLAWYNLKEVGLSFYLPQKYFHRGESWSEYKQLHPSSADHSWMVAERSGPHLWLMFLIGYSWVSFHFSRYWFALMRDLIVPPRSGQCGLAPWWRNPALRDKVVPNFEVSPPFTSPGSKLHLFSCLEDGSNHTYLCIYLHISLKISECWLRANPFFNLIVNLLVLIKMNNMHLYGYNSFCIK